MNPFDWRSARGVRLLSLGANLFASLLVLSALALLLFMLVLGVTDAGPSGVAILSAAASVVVLWLGLRFVVPRLRRIRPRFTLKMVFAAIFVASLGLASMGWRLERARQEKQIVREIYASGGGITLDQPNPEWLCRLLGKHANFTIRGVDEVNLNWRGIPDSVVDDSVWSSLSGLRIRGLSAFRTNFNDHHLAQIAQFQDLETLAIPYTAVTDDGLKHLLDLDQLRELHLSGAAVSDSGIAHLSRMKTLQDLDLCGTGITDNAIPHLTQMNQLRKLHLVNTAISDEGARKLQRALPKCTIFLPDGTVRKANHE